MYNCDMTKCIVITIISLIIILSGCSYEKQPDSDRDFLSIWMDYVDDDIMFNQIIMPGSHDAASYTMKALAETQSNTIYEQLNNGVRYFDIRVRRDDDRLVIYHSIINGVDYEDVAKDIGRFAKENPSQFFIIDLSTRDGVINDALIMLDSYASLDNHALSGNNNVNHMTMGDLRGSGKQFVILYSSIPDDYQDYVHSRKDNLVSPYIPLYHYLEGDGLIVEGHRVYLEQAVSDKLFVLQSQRTANTLITPRTLEDRFKPHINSYLDNLEDMEVISKLNIILRDYVDEDMDNIRIILSLNLKKGTINVKLLDDFVNQLNELNVI